MNKLTQTTLNDDKNGVIGNCMMTCYASFLDLDFKDVPPIEKFFYTEIPEGYWWDVLMNWFTSIGCEFRQMHDDPYHNPERWGLKKPFTGWYFVSGISPRNKDNYHLVIYKKGKLFWDVHPDRTGIMTEKTFEIVTVVDKNKFNKYTKQKR